MLALVPVAVAAVLVVTSRGGDGAPGPSRAVPFTLDGVVEGAPPVALAAAPERPVVLNFFASWCEPCRRELPLLEATARQQAGRVDVIGVAVADGQTASRRMLASAGVSFPAGADPRREVASRYAVVGMPTTYFIAAGGRVVGQSRGELRAPELRRWLERLERA